MALATAGTTGWAAPAESAPGCPGAVQIGSTAYVKVGGQTAASVKQFKGCGKNYGYTYVWQSYRSTHGGWTVCAAIANRNDMTLNGLRCGGGSEVWSSGTNTLSACTRAVGFFPDVAKAETDTRC
ncbi:hypothetical protein HC031_13470 [Planosporangium thailandense]|uniref:Secreted protein n=1 Tax=Planosporangium thailandense TaxID=765197 RepID=A0ABX0XXG4_9ACTN|nr:hypothetical protein [Planosporangium thailandense]NJC70716.1 hypothetical protein [Planosporangium thailandense]